MNGFLWMLVITIIVILGLAIWCQTGFGDEIDDLVPFIIQIESGGRSNAVSKVGAIGLMQITPIVLEEWNDNLQFHLKKDITDLFNPKQNIYIGTWYLRRLKNHYLKENYTIERMLAAYNGGITRLRKVNYDINKMPRETRVYVRKVMKLYKEAIK